MVLAERRHGFWDKQKQNVCRSFGWWSQTMLTPDEIDSAATSQADAEVKQVAEEEEEEAAVARLGLGSARGTVQPLE